jgi:hypothetical protein
VTALACSDTNAPMATTANSIVVLDFIRACLNVNLTNEVRLFQFYISIV